MPSVQRDFDIESDQECPKDALFGSLSLFEWSDADSHTPMMPKVIQGICKNVKKRNKQNAWKHHTNSKARHLSDTKVTWKGEIQPTWIFKSLQPTWNKTNFAVPNGLTHCKETAAMAEATNPLHITSDSFAKVSSSKI